MKNPRRVNETDAILIDYPDAGSIYTESEGPTSEIWQRAESGEFGPVLDYVPPAPPSDDELLEAERKSMVCRAAAMRLVLHRNGLLDQVQAIADSDPEASIVWEYEPVYKRNDPFVEALGVDAFTPEQIDDLFREAMKL